MSLSETEARPAKAGKRRRRIFRRGPWEMAAMALIALGVFMLMQPFSLWLFSWSLTPLLVGTLGFIIVSHFPE